MRLKKHDIRGGDEGETRIYVHCLQQTINLSFANRDDEENRILEYLFVENL